MTELNELIKNYPFKCQKCEAELTSDCLIASAVIYGVVLLVSENDGFVAWSCPGCRGLSTNFIRLERESFNQVVDALRGTLINARLGKLSYHSFPYRYPLKNEDFSGCGRIELDKDEFVTVVDTQKVPNADELILAPQAPYCRHIFGSEAVSEEISGGAIITFDNEFENAIEDPPIPNADEPNFAPQALYCSYISGSEAMDSEIYAWWYNDS